MTTRDVEAVLKVLRQSDEFSRLLGQHCPDDDSLLHALSLLLVPLSRQGFVTEKRKVRLFDMAQAMGLHLQPVHFYSPVPDTSKLPDALWDEPFPLSFDAPAHTELYRLLARFAPELEDVPETAPAGTFCWRNPALYAGDAALSYCLLRHLAPSRVLEVGGGFSTLVARMAARRSPFRLECVDPYPPAWLPSVPDEMIATPVQAVPLERFTSLQAGDVLFIDSTHVAKVGSDVVFLFLRVLPRLRPGVVVHIHDIFLPDDYPRAWVKQHQLFWSEQYLLAALLQGSREWEVIAANDWASKVLPQVLQEAFPWIYPPGGSSFWMRRVGG